MLADHARRLLHDRAALPDVPEDAAGADAADHAREGRASAFTLRFQLSKISHVGIVVLRGTQTVFATSAELPVRRAPFAVPALKRTGHYTVHLAATDLAGNFNRIVGSVQITR